LVFIVDDIEGKVAHGGLMGWVMGWVMGRMMGRMMGGLMTLD